MIIMQKRVSFISTEDQTSRLKGTILEQQRLIDTLNSQNKSLRHQLEASISRETGTQELLDNALAEIKELHTQLASKPATATKPDPQIALLQQLLRAAESENALLRKGTPPLPRVSGKLGELRVPPGQQQQALTAAQQTIDRLLDELAQSRSDYEVLMSTHSALLRSTQQGVEHDAPRPHITHLGTATDTHRKSKPAPSHLLPTIPK
jgi:chromosome segregation ATPase